MQRSKRQCKLILYNVCDVPLQKPAHERGAMEILLVAAVLPAIALMVYVYKKDTIEKEPPGLIAKLFVLGMIAGPIAGTVESLLFNVFESIIPSGTLLIVLEFFIGVAVVEEGFKYLFLSTIRKNPNFNYVFDGIVYAVAVALGFAALENVMYVFMGGLEVAAMRAIFSVPGHCADGVVMGCFFGLARMHEVRGQKARASLYYVLAFVLPVIEHGFYDSALSVDNDVLSFVAMAVQLAFIFFAFTLVKNVSAKDHPIGIEAPASATATSELPQGQIQDGTGQQVRPASTPEVPPIQQPTIKDWEQANQQNGVYSSGQDD